MTYNVFGGTLNVAQSQSEQQRPCSTSAT